MKTGQINGKAIYSPKGKAGEYAKYAVNFYVGCSNDCDYCYCKRGVLGHAMGAPKATLKKCFKGHSPYGVFIRELNQNIVQYRQDGIFFSFTTDPLLPETQDLTNAAVLYAVSQGVPCKILTKRADFKVLDSFYPFRHLIAYGFTLTGHDEMEPGASTNMDRIYCMRKLHELGFKTFASIEPVITLRESSSMIFLSPLYCDLYLIGLMSGKKLYTPEQVRKWKNFLDHFFRDWQKNPLSSRNGPMPKVYWKNSVLEYLGIKREQLDNTFNVNQDYNIFKDQ